jgi:hypothetical protein
MTPSVAVVIGLALGGIVGLAVIRVARAGANALPGLGPRFFPGALVVAGSGAMLYGFWHLASERFVGTTCQILRSEVRELGTERSRRWEVHGIVRWQASGRDRVTKPGTLAQFDSREAAHDAVADRLHAGATLACTYRAADRGRIFYRASPGLLAGGGMTAAVFVGAGAVALVAGIRRRRRAPRGRRMRLSGTTGLSGLLALAALVGGYILDDAGNAAGVPLCVVGGAALIGLVVFDTWRSGRVFARVKQRFSDVRPWRPLGATDIDGIQPNADQRVAGRWDSRWLVWVAMHAEGAEVRVAVPGWPAGLSLRPRTSADTGGAVTGDPLFDERITLTGSEELWRPRLSAVARTALVTLLVEHDGTIDREAQAMVLRLRDAELGDLESLTDLAVATAHDLCLGLAPPEAGMDAAIAPVVDELVESARDFGADPSDALANPWGAPFDPDVEPPAWGGQASRDLEGRVFQLARQEPVAAVRAGHYKWLVARQWRVRDVLVAGSQDDDGAICSWAREQLPPDTGPYR